MSAKRGVPRKAVVRVFRGTLYLDVVVQGYLRAFGEAGARRFFDSTSGWNAPVMDDRENPVYPRHQLLAPDERDFVDAALRRLRVTIIDRHPV